MTSPTDIARRNNIATAYRIDRKIRTGTRTRVPLSPDDAKAMRCPCCGGTDLEYRDADKPHPLDHRVGLGDGWPEEISCNDCGDVVAVGLFWKEKYK